ncbi:MAG: hypothetical protein ACYCQK_06440, partial [Acidiferrobacteraceae bacterium]
LTQAGDIAFFSEDAKLETDHELTVALKDHARGFLRTYLASLDRPGLRLGAIGPVPSVREWGPVSLFLEEDIVRELYPVSGPVGSDLTSFQRRNQEKSLYRGMELLLEYRNMQYPSACVYCPLLFDRGATLGSYKGLRFCVSDTNRDRPSVDVVNLAATVPLDRREAKVFVALKDRIYRALIRKDRRRPAGLELLGRVHGFDGDGAGPDASYVGAERHGGRDVQATFLSGLDKLHAALPADALAHWTQTRQYRLEATKLREFIQFRDLEGPLLELIAAKAEVFTTAPGARLLERGKSDPWNLFLLEGSVTLTPAEGATLTVEAGSAAAKSPLAFLRPRKYVVTALTRVTFLLVHDRLLEAIRTIS